MSSNTRGGPTVRRVPDGDNQERLTCPECGFVAYENPKVVVGAVCRWHDEVLLCRRAIQPQIGKWTLPAGYLELHETAEAGARREVWEEALARIEIDQLLAVYNIPRISQIQLIYHARLLERDFAAGDESLEVALFGWDEIPWDDLAFPSVRWALDHFRDQQATGDRTTRANPPGESGGW